jgi:ribosome-binding factor A
MSEITILSISMSAIMRYSSSSGDPVPWSGAEPGEDDSKSSVGKSRRKARNQRSGRAGPRVQGVDRKASQLCRQVAVTLDEVFADCGDSVLQNLHVASVAPFPDASRLLVTVSPVDGRLGIAYRPDVVLDHLNRAGGHLRFEVAAAVTRKRTPLLLYRLAELAVPGSS